jgi:ubiquinone/menaquinone biosynthesis C-methylase UbiE
MGEHESTESEGIRKTWNDRADTYDEWYKTFQGAAENYVDLELLKKYLPKDKNAKILDAAGGTGRITLPLARMGYSVTLCDLSPAMLDGAKRKMLKEGVNNKVKILECDIRKLHFADESFDFVLCWNGAMEAAEELIRVTKKGGMISVFLINKWAYAVDDFYKHPDSNLDLVKSTPCYVQHHEQRIRAVTPDEARDFFEEKGVRVLDIYGVCGWMDVLGIPKGVQNSHNWDQSFFKKTTEIMLELSKEPSVKGISGHLVLYGEKKGSDNP